MKKGDFLVTGSRSFSRFRPSFLGVKFCYNFRVRWVEKLWQGCLRTLFPARCALCGVIGLPAFCEDCRSEIAPLDPAVRILGDGNPLDVVVSCYPFEGRAAQAVKRLKYSRATALAGPLAAEIRSAYERHSLDEFDLIVPVPVSARRLRDRGFNQSDLLSENLPAEHLDKRCLRRIRHTRPQVGLTADQRLTNLKGAFTASASVRGKSILLVDDVVTSGGTGIACADALLAAGATKVGLLTFCGEAEPDAYRSGDSRP